MPKESSAPDSALAGTQTAAHGSFIEMYEANFRAVYRTCLLMSRNPAVAEEATQEAFVRALERWSRLEGQPWVAGWVARTAMNFVRRSMKRMAVRMQPNHGGERDLSLVVDLQRGMASLPRRQQEAFVLRYVLDLSVAETAAVMRCSGGTVKAHLARARSAIETYLVGGSDE